MNRRWSSGPSPAESRAKGSSPMRLRPIRAGEARPTNSSTNRLVRVARGIRPQSLACQERRHVAEAHPSPDDRAVGHQRGPVDRLEALPVDAARPAEEALGAGHGARGAQDRVVDDERGDGGAADRRRPRLRRRRAAPRWQPLSAGRGSSRGSRSSSARVRAAAKIGSSSARSRAPAIRPCASRPTRMSNARPE